MASDSKPSRQAVEALFRDLADSLSESIGNTAEGPERKTLNALAYRLRSLEACYRRCLEVNDAYLVHAPGSFDDYVEGQKLVIKFGDLIVGTLDLGQHYELVDSSRISSFSPSLDDGVPVPAPADELQQQLGSELEAYYYSASKFWDVLEGQFLGKKKVKFIGVKSVRNWLLEHDKGKISSFGATDKIGPVVKPMLTPEIEEKKDMGLILNTAEMLALALQRLAG